MPYFRKSEKNFFSAEKSPTLTFKIEGFGGQKSFSVFFVFFLEIKFRWKKSAKNFFSGKKSDFKFQNRCYFGKKLFRIFLESSVIISLRGGDSRYWAKTFKNIFKWTKIRLQFSKSGVFRGKKVSQIFSNFAYN